MARIFVSFAALVGLLIPAFAQVARRSLDPDSILFQAFFRQVVQTDEAAAALRAKGKPDAPARDYFKNRAGLNATEDGLLKEVARSCTTDYQAESQRGIAVVQALKTQYPNVSSLPPAAVAQVNSLEDARNRVTAMCVDRLRAAMGSRFQQLDTFVRQTVGPTIHKVDAGSVK